MSITGAKLQELRKRTGFSQPQFAEAVGMSASGLRKLEQDADTVIHLRFELAVENTLFRIAIEKKDLSLIPDKFRRLVDRAIRLNDQKPDYLKDLGL